MNGIEEVSVRPVPLRRLEPLLTSERVELLETNVAAARRLLAGRTVWNVNSTARGGGVAEMLRTLVAYAAGTGVDVRWLVVGGDPAFFAVTKRIHNRLHGVPGDGGALDGVARATYDGTPGHPVLIGRGHWAGVIESAIGDQGARSYLGSHQVELVECGDLATGRDVDDPTPGNPTPGDPTRDQPAPE